MTAQWVDDEPVPYELSRAGWAAASRNANEAIELVVEMNDDPLQRMQVRLNPVALGWWAVVELEDDGSGRVVG